MKVGVVGLGKVGLPLALVLADAAKHDVVGHDLQEEAVRKRLTDPQDHGEAGLGGLIDRAGGKLHLGSLYQLVQHAEVVFVAVQTPHAAGYDGARRVLLDDDRPPRDFDYQHLKAALGALDDEVEAGQRRPLPVAVVSTVLPGTLRRLRGPRGSWLRLVYSPVFVALGTTIRNLLFPDLLLLGHDPENLDAARLVERAWQGARALRTDPYYCTVESAELLKVALNGYLSQQIAFANHLATLAHAIPGADVDEVTDGLARSQLAMGPTFLRAGLGDGGPCRPRDLLALAWLEDQAEAGHDLFRQLALARERHADRIATVTADLALHDWRHPQPVRVLGWSYKNGSRLLDGSPARLLHDELTRLVDDVHAYDPLALPDTWPPPADPPGVWVLATPHREFDGFPYPPGSAVVDPWGRVPDQPDVLVVRWGRR